MTITGYHYHHVVIAAILTLAGLYRSAWPAEPHARIWDHDNLVGWEVAPYDAKMRGSEERARMLQRLGIRSYAYLPARVSVGEDADGNRSQLDVDAEIEAMLRHHIDVLAWYFWVNYDDPAQDPNVTKTLAAFARHHIHPQVWVSESSAYLPQNKEAWATLLPQTIDYPKTKLEYDKLPEVQKHAIRLIRQGAEAIVELANMPKTQGEQEERVQREADRILAFVKLAAPYGCKIAIYNHRGWFGYIDNQLAILKRLSEMGVTDVGMVYNFSHSRDSYHDDSKRFSQLWERMKGRVVAVNITGISDDGAHPLYPSQGHGEFEMMRTIEKSGWWGPIGLLGDKWGDAEKTLEQSLVGLDWIAAEISKPGSGGPKPDLPVL